MKKFLVTVILLASSLNCFANDIINSPKVAVIDLQKIFRDSLSYKSVSDQVNKKRTEWQSDISKKEADLGKINQELNKQESVLSKQAYDEKFREFSDKVASVQREFQTKKNIIDQSELDAINKIEEVVSTIVSNIAEKNKFAMVIPTASIMYYMSSLDITNEVLTMLDQKLKNVDVNFSLPQNPTTIPTNKKK